MTDTPIVPITPMTRIKVRLGDFGLARENARYDEPADDGIPQLADTLLAAGVVIPPIVRPGRKGEQSFMALDGRRRRMGLLLLKDLGNLARARAALAESWLQAPTKSSNDEGPDGA